jgi:glycosyltransferase involved in cell wall biosynthesis
MANEPRVSIVVPFFNCAYVGQAIESALSQTHPNVEVIVVNDGSCRHTEQLTPYRDRIRIIDKANGGTATALNAGLRAASGAYWTWLSSDDLYHPEKVARQLAFICAFHGGSTSTGAYGKAVPSTAAPS